MVGAREDATRLPGEGESGCAACAEWPVILRAATAPYAFGGTASRLVRALKYGRWRALAEPMGRSMRASTAALFGEGDCTPTLVPVPLTPARTRERGFNQAALLAEVLGRDLEWRCASLIERRPGGRRQARLARHARSENVRGAFQVRCSGTPEAVVVLVDDVLTTGSTALACAAALGEAGFGRVSVVTFARTLRPPEIKDDEG
jgi:ComF family protein